MWGEYEAKGLVVLALSDEAAGTVEKHIAAKGMTYPTAAGANSSRAYGVKGIPAGFLIDHTGTIIWQGNPHDSSWEGMLDAALTKAETMADRWDPGDRPEYLNKAVALARKGAMGKVWKETESLLQRFAEEPSKLAAVRDLQTAFQQRATSRMTQVTELTETGRYQEASDYLTAQIKTFKGSPPAAEWNALLKDWKKDAEIKQLMGLDKKRLKALQKAYDGKVDKAKRDLLALYRKAKGTRIASAVDDAYNLVATMASN